jgi:hypothetical protein
VQFVGINHGIPFSYPVDMLLLVTHVASVVNVVQFAGDQWSIAYKSLVGQLGAVRRKKDVGSVEGWEMGCSTGVNIFAYALTAVKEFDNVLFALRELKRLSEYSGVEQKP